MITDEIRQLSEELPEHQSSRGDEFRAIPVEDRDRLARWLLLARGMAENDGDNTDPRYRKHLRKYKNHYYYVGGQLNLDRRELANIWWSVVHDNPAPYERINLI